MKEIVLNFVSILAIVVGLALALQYYFCTLTVTGCEPRPFTAFIGVPLLAVGLTRFYMRSRFYKKNSK